MRTVEQIVSELKKAQEATKAAKKIEDKLTQELQDIYNAAKSALGIKELFQPR